MVAFFIFGRMKTIMNYKLLFREILIIISLSLLFGVVYNFFAYNEFNFIQKAKLEIQKSVESDFRKITIEEAQKYFDISIIIDARSESDFLMGHIPNAINIPAKDFEKYIDKIFELPQDTQLIIYCEGIHCNLSHVLAEKIKIFGFKNIAIMYEGIEGWIRRNLPVEK